MINLAACPLASPLQGGMLSPLQALNSDYQGSIIKQRLYILATPSLTSNLIIGGFGYDYGLKMPYSQTSACMTWLLANWTLFLNSLTFLSNPAIHPNTFYWDGSKIDFTLSTLVPDPYGGLLSSGYWTDALGAVSVPSGTPPNVTGPPFYYSESDVPNFNTMITIECFYLNSNTIPYFITNYIWGTDASITVQPNYPSSIGQYSYRLYPLAFSMPYFMGGISFPQGDAFPTNLRGNGNVVPITKGNLKNGWLIVKPPPFVDVSNELVWGAGQGDRNFYGELIGYETYTGVDDQSCGRVNIATILG